MSKLSFEELMQNLGVVPLKKTNDKIINQPKTKINLNTYQNTTNIKPKISVLSNHFYEEKYPDSLLSFKKATVSIPNFKKFKQGKILSEDYLDLHNLTIDQAREELTDFLKNARQNYYRCVLIIHGKGGKNGGHSLLKTQVNSWLQQINFVLAFHSAQNKDGGTGAVYVLLQKSDKHKNKYDD